ncbi:MAG TPA: transporter substrate-binding domain-containing protein [Stellaceae bacterium]|nr:transporter substrate-binding domain-containing protein [Stellaceae bacterium]
MLRSRARFLALALLLLATAASAQTAPPASPSRLDQIMERGVLRVGSTGDYKPFTFEDPETKAFQGIDIAMAQSLAKALGVKLEIVKTSWPNLMSDFLADKFDVAMGGVSVTLERQKKGLFSIPYLVDGKAAIARCADAGKYASLDAIDQPGVRVIVNPGGTNERFDRDHLKRAQIEVYKDNVTIFDQIAAGKADLMITDASETRLQQKLHEGQLCAIHPDRPFNFAEKAYLLPRDELFKDFVDQWLHQALMTKEYDAAAEAALDRFAHRQ